MAAADFFANSMSAIENECDCQQLVVGGGSDRRNRRHMADGQASAVNVGYGASIFGSPMSAIAVLEPFNSKSCTQNLNDRFDFADCGSERPVFKGVVFSNGH